MTRLEAIKVFEIEQAFSLCGSDYYKACSVAISDMRKMQYLEGRPCEVCSCHNEKGCGVWECVFDGKENV